MLRETGFSLLPPPPHGGDLARARARFGGACGEWIDFSNSINPYGLPGDLLREILVRAEPDLRTYPDPAYPALRRALASYHGLDEKNVWPLAGSVEGLHGSVRLFLGRPVVAPAPSFREAAAAARAHGFACEEPILWSPVKGATAWIDAVPENGLFVLANPNSPTGEILDRDLLEEIRETSRARGTTLLVDEAFLPFAADESDRTMIPAAADSEDLIVLRSLTKSHALPGLRLGYAVAGPPVIERLRAVLPPWSVGPLAGAFAESLSAFEPLLRAQLALVAREAVRLGARLRDLPLRVLPSACNFFLCELPADGPGAEDLKERLAGRRLLIRACGDYPGLTPRHFRIAVRRPEENDRLLAALREEFGPR